MKWDQHWLKIAQEVSKLSKDTSTKVGAVLVRDNNTKISTGYNGFVKGIEETTEKWQRPLKYQYVRHAEENAIVFAPFDTNGSTIYITHQPCHRCIGLLAQAGITRIVYEKTYNNIEYKEIWEEHAKLFTEVIQLSIMEG